MAKTVKDKFKYFFGFEPEDDEMLAEEYNEAPQRNTSYQHENYQNANYQHEERSQVFPTSTKNRVVNIHNNANIKIEVYQPRSFDDAVEIVDCLRSKRPVVVNLETVDQELARKIFDFLSGALCAIDGRAEKVAKGIFLMAPNNVQIKGAAEQPVASKESKDNGSIFSFRE